jgi:hypothetical protein
VGLQRPRSLVTANQLSAVGNKQTLTARQIVSTQRHTLKVAPHNIGNSLCLLIIHFVPKKFLI